MEPRTGVIAAMRGSLYQEEGTARSASRSLREAQPLLANLDRSLGGVARMISTASATGLIAAGIALN